MSPIGIIAWCNLYNPALGFYEIRPTNLTMSIKRSTSESRCNVRLTIPADDLSEISNRSDSTGQIYVLLEKTYDRADTEIAKFYIFNNKGFDYAQGGKSSTVEINGTKYITAVTPVARTLSRWISKDVQKLGAGYRTVYAVPVLDIIDWNPSDTLPDGTITSIDYQLSAKSATATIEVQ